MTPIQLSHYNEAEIILPSEVPGIMLDRLKLTVPISLPERRIYVYEEVLQSATAQFNLRASVTAYRGGRPVGEWPCNLADFTGMSPGRSISTLFNAGGSPVGDSLTVRLAQPFVPSVTSVVIQPLRVNGEFDEISFSLRGLTGANLVGFRAFLAVLSTKY